MTVMNVKGRERERELSKHFPTWKRLFSFHFRELIYKCEILKIIKDESVSGNSFT